MSHDFTTAHRSSTPSPLPRLTAEVLGRLHAISEAHGDGSANLPAVDGPREARVLAAAGACLELVGAGADDRVFAQALARMSATIESATPR